MKPSGILVLSNLKNIKDSLKIVTKYVNNLYIHLNLPSEIKFHTPQWSSIISKIYVDSLSYHDPKTLDIKVLVNSIKKPPSFNPNLENIQHLFMDGKFPDLCNSLKNFYQIDKPPMIICDETKSYFDINDNKNENFKTHDVVVLGGTFDRLHTGHKIFLTEAVLRACKKLVVGVTDKNMLKNKVLSEIIQSTEQRINHVKKFLTEIDHTLNYEVVGIQDPFGPTQSDPNMDMILVSSETYRGGLKVNEIRKQNNLKELDIHCIELVEEKPDEKCSHKESKVSSSNSRMDLLGKLLIEPEPRPNLPNKPYIIGLTGNIGSGKSKMALRFAEMGAHIIDCDKVAHDVYEPGHPAYIKVIEYFGKEILNPADNKIDRKKLGPIVFSDPKQLEKLNEIVWPEIILEAKRRIAELKDSYDIVILEAAVLLKANWEKECHEVWSMVIPTNEAIKRVQERNNLTEDEARKRIESQVSNEEIVAKSNVIFSSNWSYEFTQHQAERAWFELKNRLLR